jgi:DUF4097 and DUF4098 domain-containing protein YvlB
LLIIIHFLLLIVLTFSQQALYAISFKGLTSWVTGTKELTYFQELPLEDNKTVTIENNVGTLLIKSWSLPKVAIEAIKTAPEKDINNLEIETLTFPNQLSIRTLNKTKNGYVDYQIMVPVHTNIVIKMHNGSVKIKNVEGIIQASMHNGPIDIQGAVTSTQLVTSGPITVTFSSLPLQSCISLKSLKSHVNVTFPLNTHASLKAATTYNSIISQHFITLKPITLTLNKQTWENFKKQISGNLGNGGAFIDISAYNGISILQPN